MSGRYPREAVLSQTAHGAVRSATGFASWTSLYALTNCTLRRTRRRDDLLNPAIAGAFAGGALTCFSLRGHWRFHRTQIATNAGASAVFAIVFDAMNRM